MFGTSNNPGNFSKRIAGAFRGSGTRCKPHGHRCLCLPNQDEHAAPVTSGFVGRSRGRRGVVLIGPVGKAPTDLRCYDLCPFLGPLAKSKLWPDQADPAQRVEAVSKLIQTQIDPASWRESGGTVGAAHEYGGLLLVRHSLSVQEEIAGLLRTLP